MIVQLRLELWDKPTPAFLCDTCDRLVWHANDDGYCCCIAPGMERIGAKTRKPLDASCTFFRKREDNDQD